MNGSSRTSSTNPAATEAAASWTPQDTRAADLAAWMLSRDTGISSEALAAAAFGQYRNNHDCYPHDPADLGRCLRLIERCPWAKEGLPVLASRNAVWARLADAWSELERLYAADEAERAGRWRMPRGWESRTYARMQELIYQRPDISGSWEGFTDELGRWDKRKRDLSAAKARGEA